MKLLTAAQMRAIEQAAIDSGEVTGLELMERAGAGVVEAIFEWRPELTTGERRAVILCGPGNNGGDGFVVARLLKERGWTVDAFLYGNGAKLPPDAAENARRWREMDGETLPLSEENLNHRVGLESGDALLVMDALFGTGLTRSCDEPLAAVEKMLDMIANVSLWREVYWVAIDMPSGLCADSGRLLGKRGFEADLTVTFHALKHGHCLAQGPDYCCTLRHVDIGLDRRTARRALADLHDLRNTPRDLDKHLVGSPAPAIYATRLRKSEFSHKYSHGHALNVSGGMARTGAARLAARGALRVGAGLVTVASPPGALMENAAHLTAIMPRKMKGADGLRDILSDNRINAVAIGPGCGVGEETRALVEVALSRAETRDLDGQRADQRGPASSAGQRTTVLDADALTSFSGDPEALFTAIKASPCAVILTPHGGEFARLFPDIAEKLAETPTKGPAYSKVDATREAAARSGATVLYKGPDTVIARPDGRCSIVAAVYERAAPWLATAGSGDVLAGMIAGLAARGLSDPAESAAWLHQECGRALGPGLIAEDIPEAIPGVMKRLLGWEAR